MLNLYLTEKQAERHRQELLREASQRSLARAALREQRYTRRRQWFNLRRLWPWKVASEQEARREKGDSYG